MVTLEVINSSLETVIFDPKEMLGMLDLRSIGFFKIKQEILQKNLSKYYRFESTNVLFEQVNEFINTLKKEKQKTTDKYPWLNQGDKRRNMSEREIFDKYVDEEKSCLSDSERKQVIAYIIEI